MGTGVMARVDLDTARTIAEEIADRLRPECKQVEVAGSIRRQKPHPKDVEICYVPQLYQCLDLFGKPSGEPFQLPDKVIGAMLEEGILAWDEEVRRAGPKYKRLIHVASGMVIDLFTATADNWGLILALRTGPGDFNKLLVTKTMYGGAMRPGFVMQGGRLWHAGQPCYTPSEEVFFATLLVPCWPPEERTAERLERYLRERQD